MELLYRHGRQGDVATAGDSIVEYANWIASDESGDPLRSPILKAIRDYNEDDCRSTAELANWLRSLQREHGVEVVLPAIPMNGADNAEEGTDPVDPVKQELLAASLRRLRKSSQAGFGNVGIPPGLPSKRRQADVVAKI